MKGPRFVDMKAIAWHAMEKYGFAPRFPDPVIREVNAIAAGMPPADPGEMKDLRSLLWSSIDNADSLDLDQLEYCEHGPGGEIKVMVAVSDVDLFVKKESQTDRHAAHNGTSVYTGIVIFPLLPDRLSHGITSLLSGQDRAAIVIGYTVMPDGSVRHGDVYRAMVRSRAKLIYEEIGDWLEGTGPVPETVRDVPGLEEQLRLQDKTARILNSHRMAQGALDLNTLEARAVIDGTMVRDLVLQTKNRARSIIEEFMVAANRTMVARLERAGVTMIERVVRTPKNWEGIVMTAAKYGEKLPTEPDAKALALFLDRQKKADPERFPDLSLTVVKLLGFGEYIPLEPHKPPVGHFALAVTYYTHSTAPNRRYVDIINQRILKSVLDGKPPLYTSRELADRSGWLTDREKASKKVERFMRKAAAAVLLKDRVGESFDAIVTGASEKGTYVRLITPPAEGRVMQGEHGLMVGQKVRVRLLSTDAYHGFIDFICIARE